MALFILLFGLNLFVQIKSLNYSQAISPADYQKLIAQGFATKYFNVITDPPMKRYREQNIQHVYDAGFRNLRLRCSSNPYPYGDDFTTFLSNLTTVVDKCLEVGVMPIISWADSKSRIYATEVNRTNYLSWWEQVARLFQDRDYRLSFNLFTELSNSHCETKPDCPESLASNNEKYTNWTKEVINRIRRAGGYNDKRILILGTPGYTSKGFTKINRSIYEEDEHLMIEHHIYAAGPNKKVSDRSGLPLQKYWEGCGSTKQRQTLLEELQRANESISLKTYFGAWMPIDNTNGGLNQSEAECFAKFFVKSLKEFGTPWSLNDLHMYYNTEENSWITDIQNRGMQLLDMQQILAVIKANM